MFIPTREVCYTMPPTRFEEYSLELLQEQFEGLSNLKFDFKMIEKLDYGKYQVSGNIAFTKAGLNYRVVVECKHFNGNITANEVAALHCKLKAQKATSAVLISSSGFRPEALQYATQNGIALVQLTPAEEEINITDENLLRLMHAAVELYNDGKKYIGVLQTYNGTVQKFFLTKSKQSLVRYIVDVRR